MSVTIMALRMHRRRSQRSIPVYANGHLIGRDPDPNVRSALGSGSSTSMGSPASDWRHANVAASSTSFLDRDEQSRQLCSNMAQALFVDALHLREQVA
jgi:hypothetical protein